MVRFYKLVVVTLILVVVACNRPQKLEWSDAGPYRWAELPAEYFESAEYGFSQVPSSQSAITFSNTITEQELSDNRHYLNGSGVAAGDIDGDGYVDLYFAGLKAGNRLYKNLGGMEFKDVTESAGVAHQGYYSTGAVFADVNGDTHLDLLVTSIYKDITLYINDGTGTFSKAEDSGLGPGAGSTTMTLADIDGDQDLDLYVAKYKEKSVKDIYSTEELEYNAILNEPYNKQQQTGSYTLVPPFDEHYEIFMDENSRLVGLAETGQQDELYLNEGGRFDKVEDTRPVFRDENGQPYGLQTDWGLTAKFQDLNDDGHPDLYVCNDFFTKDRVWINQGDGTFHAIQQNAIRNLSFACMGVDMGDINRDGELDIFTAEMLSPEHNQRLQQVGSDDPHPGQYRQTEARPTNNRNSLYLKREDHTYAEISYLSGVEGTGWSWDASFLDIDLDGYEDLIVNTGYLYHILDMDAQIGMMRRGRNMDEHFTEFMKNAPSLKLQNRILMNNQDLTFSDKSSALGFEDEDISHGMAIADLNNDGTLDLAINRMNQEAGIFKNKTDKARIGLRLVGEAPNTQAIGAKVQLQGGPVVQEKELSSGGDFLSGSDPLVVFAADPANANHQLTITWPDGRQTKIDSLKANRIYEVSEAESNKVEPGSVAEKSVDTTIFEDISSQVNHRHQENNFEDFQLQPLLPIAMSNRGPGVAWFDIDSDNDDDLLITSSMNGQLDIIENQKSAGWSPMNLEGLDFTAPGDQTGLVGWKSETGTQLAIGSANYEQGQLRVASAYSFTIENSQAQLDSLPDNISTTGPLSATDYDNDGDVDLFVGGRFIPGHYPMEAPSRFYLNEDGNFRIDKANSEFVKQAGLVSGSIFTDIDRDGDQDLVLAREWDSILILENDNGEFRDASAQYGVEQIKGWWNGVASGDFNNDGNPDLVATNQGLNSPYQLEMGQPIRMYYNDFDGDRWIDIIESYVNEEGNYVPRKRLYRYGTVPSIRNKIRSHQQFANTSLQEIFGTRLQDIPYKEVNILEHTLFLSNENGNEYHAHHLPIEAQFSTAFHAGTADMDNDGNEDLFLSQNLFSFARHVPRQDAGRGLWLKGDGKGNFMPVPGSQSGIKVYGEQRGAAFSDVNSDGKIDLAVSQNNYHTKVYLNRTENRGISITLEGPPSNKNAVGSSLRLIYEDGSSGPLREIQAGSGYWSQNSFTQILGRAGNVDKIRAYWFDGRVSVVNVDKDVSEYVIQHPGLQ